MQIRDPRVHVPLLSALASKWLQETEQSTHTAVAVGRAHRSLRFLLRPPLNGTIVGQTSARSNLSAKASMDQKCLSIAGGRGANAEARLEASALARRRLRIAGCVSLRARPLAWSRAQRIFDRRSLAWWRSRGMLIDLGSSAVVLRSRTQGRAGAGSHTSGPGVLDVAHNECARLSNTLLHQPTADWNARASARSAFHARTSCAIIAFRRCR